MREDVHYVGAFVMAGELRGLLSKICKRDTKIMRGNIPHYSITNIIPARHPSQTIQNDSGDSGCLAGSVANVFVSACPDMPSVGVCLQPPWGGGKTFIVTRSVLAVA